MFRPYLLIWIILLLPTRWLNAQLSLHYEQTEIDYSRAGIRYSLQSGSDFSNNALRTLQAQDWKPLQNKKLNISHIPYAVWLKIPLAGLKEMGSFELLQIDNPHINVLQAWILSGDSIKKKFTITGDHYPFENKALPGTGFVFDISSSLFGKDTLVLAIDKRSSKLSAPLVFCRVAFHAEYASTQLIRYGLFLGVLVVLLSMILYMYLIGKERVYLWYIVYLIIIMAYISTDSGFAFKYVYPQLPQINDLIRPFLFSASLFPLLLFFNDLLQIKKILPHVLRFNNKILSLYGSVFLIALATSIPGDSAIQKLWLTITAILAPIFYCILFFEAIYCVKKGIRFSWFMLLSFGNFTPLITIFLLAQNDMIAQNSFTGNAHYWALFLDAAIVAASLLWRIKIYKQEAEALDKKLITQKEQLFQQAADWQKQSMEVFSGLLHDSVGANLGLLRLKTDNMPLNEKGREEISSSIGQLAEEVRFMSHHYSPLRLQQKGLQAALQELTESLKREAKIEVQYEWIGASTGLSFQYEIIVYRFIQELFQNTLKHAQATELFLQVLVNESILSIYVEDNGIGCDASEIFNKGIGLKTIQEQVALLQGKLLLNTSKGEGFNATIEFHKTML